MRRSIRSIAAATAVVSLLTGCFMIDTDPGPVPQGTPAPTVQQPVPSVTTPSVPPPSPSETAEEPQDPAEVFDESWLATTGPLPSAGCAAAGQDDLGSAAGVESYYRSVLDCLHAAWSQADPDMTPALLEVFSGPAPSDSCGAGAEYSFYCQGTGTIYMYADEISTPWNDYAGDEFSHGLTRLAASWVIAHEFGHHVQNVVGIWSAIGDDWPGTETERRLELQASCFADVFLSSQADAYPVASDYWQW